MAADVNVCYVYWVCVGGDIGSKVRSRGSTLPEKVRSGSIITSLASADVMTACFEQKCDENDNKLHSLQTQSKAKRSTLSVLNEFKTKSH